MDKHQDDSSEKVEGRAKGGRARMAAMTPDQRSAQSRKAADARWGRRNVLKATHGSPDHPLRVGDVEIDCYVLEDDTRVVTQRSMIKALGLTRAECVATMRLKEPAPNYPVLLPKFGLKTT